jgi:hypothetical protein
MVNGVRIKFDLRVRIQIIAAHDKWCGSSARDPLGSSLKASQMEQEGDKISLLTEAGFLDHLRSTKIPFDLV